MNEKLKKLALKLSDLIPDKSTPQSVYDGLVPVMQSQKDYFKYLGPHNIVKLTIYIYSYSEGKGFNLGDKMINSLGFANVFTTEGTEYVEECSNCSGEGEVDCDYCDRGEIQCNQCDGTGEVNCSECDGEGRQMGDGEWEDCEYCEGTGNMRCEDCGGDGYLQCDNCDNGKNECWDCSGHGEVETGEVKYDAYFIVTWNRGITDDLSMSENSNYPALSEYEFDRLRDEYIVLTYEDDGHAEFRDIVALNKVYCTFYSDEPKLNLTEKMRVDNRADDYEPSFYIK
jgi:hypothetical protein